MSRLRDRALRALPLGTAAILGAVTAAFLRDDHTRLRTGLGPQLLPAAFVLDGLHPRAWQFVTYAFIHADRAHLDGNLPLLVVGGVLTELRLGPARTVAVFVALCAVVGVGFQRLDGRDLCGASGVGLALCALAATLWLRARDRRWFVRLAPALVVAPYLFYTELRPALLGHASPGALAHLVGIVGGVVAGAVLRPRAAAP